MSIDTRNINILDQVDKTRWLVSFMHFPQQGCASRLMSVRLFKYLAGNVILCGFMVMIVMTHGVGASFKIQSQGDVVKTNILING